MDGTYYAMLRCYLGFLKFPCTASRPMSHMCTVLQRGNKHCPRTLRAHFRSCQVLIMKHMIILQASQEQVVGSLKARATCILHIWLGSHNHIFSLLPCSFLHKCQALEIESRVFAFPHWWKIEFSPVTIKNKLNLHIIIYNMNSMGKIFTHSLVIWYCCFHRNLLGLITPMMHGTFDPAFCQATLVPSIPNPRPWAAKEMILELDIGLALWDVSLFESLHVYISDFI